MDGAARKTVVIVGGGPAGLSTALFLADRAPSLISGIVLLEKERYPRDKPCAGALGARGDAALETIGVRVDVPSVRIDAISIRIGDRAAVGRAAGAGRVVRRLEFDHALARIARERGIEVRDGTRVLGVEARSDGVTVRTERGVVEAEVVVGADGVAGTVRRALGFAETPHRAQAVEVDTEPASGDPAPGELLFDLSRAELPGYTWAFPTLVEGRHLVSRGVYYLKTHAGHAPLEIDRVLLEELHRRGLDPARYRKRRYAERGFAPGLSASLPRALLVGEAAGIDPVTGEGIAQAIEYGSAAGQFLGERLLGGSPDLSDWDRVMRRSKVWRDLQVRARLLPLAYGERRASVRRFLVDTPELAEVGVAHFAGRKLPVRSVARLGLAALSSAARAIFGGDSLFTGREAGLP